MPSAKVPIPRVIDSAIDWLDVVQIFSLSNGFFFQFSSFFVSRFRKLKNPLFCRMRNQTHVKTLRRKRIDFKIPRGKETRENCEKWLPKFGNMLPMILPEFLLLLLSLPWKFLTMRCFKKPFVIPNSRYVWVNCFQIHPEIPLPPHNFLFSKCTKWTKVKRRKTKKKDWL